MEAVDIPIAKDITDNINEIYKKVTHDTEFEFMFYNYANNPMKLEQSMNVLKYMKVISHRNKLKLTNEITLDTSCNGYRMTMNGIDTINRYLQIFDTKNTKTIYNALSEILCIFVFFIFILPSKGCI